MLESTLENLFNAFHNSDNPSIKRHIRIAIKKTVAEMLGEKEQRHPRLTAQEEDAAFHQGKIASIKMVRERLGIGLKEAKDLVESEMERRGYKYDHDRGGYYR